MMKYPKRLIEVDLPIARISAHARREKSIRHGHISTLHIWWARRPLAACRAVVCAALWPDPVDENCPQSFRDAAARHIMGFAHRADGDLKLLEKSSKESMARWAALVKKSPRHQGKGKDEGKKSPRPLGEGKGEGCSEFGLDTHDPAELLTLRGAMLDFIADFANWDNSTSQPYLETSRALTQAAHEALGGEPGTRPLVVDPFAGGGSIPLEALRVGADAFASDLNPVAVLLNKVVLEYIPKYGQRLADEVRKWGKWIKEQAEKELAEFYPKDPDGATPIAYLWARTIRCEGAGCGAEVPLIRSLWLAKKAKRSIALQLVPRVPSPSGRGVRGEGKGVDFKIIVKTRDGWVNQDDPKEKIRDPKFDGTVKRGSATCPCCGYTTPVARVREQLKERKGGANDAKLMCVATLHPNREGRSYRLAADADMECLARVTKTLAGIECTHQGSVSLLPDEKISFNEIRRISPLIYGMDSWRFFFTSRQLVSLVTLTRLVAEVGGRLQHKEDTGFIAAIQTCLAFAVSKEADLTNTLCSWKPDAECPVHMMARQAIPMLWDFAEAVAISESSGSWTSMVERTAYAIDSAVAPNEDTGHALQCSAASHVLPADAARVVFTDPPYYDAVPYAHLSDFFYVWLRRILADVHVDLFRQSVVPKDEEIVVDRPHELSNSSHDIAYYEQGLTTAFAEARRVVCHDGIGTIVFASKTTASWEAILKAVVDAGWIITGSWPIDTEMETRVSAQGQARLASSVHLVCRPRENPDGSVREDDVGEWRDVLGELPKRIHEWMPRLAEEGVVGADAIFACLGPALEIFSRYSRVEKASGETATLREYLEHVWAAVSTEALSMIFRDADAAGLEPDARLTAMWLWTLGGGKSGNGNGNGKGPHPSPLPKGEGTASDAIPKGEGAETEEGEASDEEETKDSKAKASGFTLEFDAARKIAQGLGIHLEKSESIVEVKGEKARLLPVAERTQFLFGANAGRGTTASGGRRKKRKQRTLFEELDEAQAAEDGWTDIKGPPPGSTVLDRLHQAMILFAAGRGELMKRFLLDDGIGSDARFWKLAQSLSALYPSGSEEKRWVDGVLARKKGLGL